MNPKEFIIITSISAPNEAMRMFAQGAKEHDMGFIVVGDTKSPPDYELAGSDYHSMDRQLQSDFAFARLCPTRHYARKNLGYLAAIAAGAQVIRDTDDDNLPRESFWESRSRSVQVPTYGEPGWTNVYRWFSDTPIWPRGLPLDEVNSLLPDYAELSAQSLDCPIQQGLADVNPDVDAVYRLLFPLPQNFIQGRQVGLASGSWCPFNSQNTTWFQDAFQLLYLPAHCSFRMTDIWRSFIAQRIAWENRWSILFHESTVWQERNEHSLMKDFEEEVSGYLNNRAIAETLDKLKLRPGIENLADNLLVCYEALCARGWIGAKEMPLLKVWLEDYAQLQS